MVRLVVYLPVFFSLVAALVNSCLSSSVCQLWLSTHRKSPSILSFLSSNNIYLYPALAMFIFSPTPSTPSLLTAKLSPDLSSPSLSASSTPFSLPPVQTPSLPCLNTFFSSWLTGSPCTLASWRLSIWSLGRTALTIMCQMITETGGCCLWVSLDSLP